MSSPPRPDRRWIAALAALTGLVALSRWLAFPASIWDLDEATFSRALLAFDPAHGYPHPPFFPLWIGLGRTVLALRPGTDPTLALRLLSATLSVLTLVPLATLWRRFLPRGQAVAAAVLYCVLPLPWLLAGRAYTSTAATAMLVTAVALLLSPEASRGAALGGATALAACILIRPQWLPVAAVIGLVLAARGRTRMARSAPLVLPTLAGAVALAGLATSAGGWSELLAAIARHALYHFGSLGAYRTDWSRTAVLSALGPPWLGLLWALLAAGGALVLLRDPSRRRPAAFVVAGVLVPLLLVLLLLEDPDSLRYVLPYLALTSGLVVAALAALVPHRRLLAGLLTALVVGCVAAALPHLSRYRTEPSPAVRALARLETLAGGERLHLVADRRLTSFVELERTRGRLDAAVTWDWQHPKGALISSEPVAAAVFDPERLPWRVLGSRSVTLRCGDPWLRRFAGGRLADVTVVLGGQPGSSPGAPGRTGPVLVLDERAMPAGGNPGREALAPFWGSRLAGAAADLAALAARSPDASDPDTERCDASGEPSQRRAPASAEVRLGPFDLGAYDAGVLAVERPAGADPRVPLEVQASLDGVTWSGYTWLGSDSPPEGPLRIDLDGWPELGNLAGRRRLLLRFRPAAPVMTGDGGPCVEGVLFERLRSRARAG